MKSPNEPDNFYPGSSAAAAGNIAMCGLIAVAVPIYALTTGLRGTDSLVAGGAFIMAIALEVQFIRKMLKSRRRANWRYRQRRFGRE
jgi:hypothetical protein